MSKTIDLSRLPDVTNDIFYQLHNNKDRYLVLMGGGGSGKSVFAAQKLVKRVISPKYRHRFLVVRKVAKTLRESVFALIKGIISDWNLTFLFDINKSDMTIKYRPNGNVIMFAGLDDVEKLKSIYNITGIWIEEASEVEPEDFRQLDIRLRGKTDAYKQIILTFNPVSITHWLKSEFFDVKKPNSTTIKTTYKNNRFLDDEAKQVLEGFKETDPYYYMVYALGEWGVIGKTIFPAQIVSERIAALRDKKPIKQGFFVFDYKNEKIVNSSIKWIDDENGYIRIYEDVQKNYPYVIGGDTAGEGSDAFTGHVINNITGAQAATLKYDFSDEDLYARQMYCLGRYYNRALLGIETNFSTYPVKELKRLGYGRQFIREIEDKISKKKKKAYGFQTNKLTRPIIIANLVKLVREHPELFNDIATLEEMLTFVRNESGKAEAQEGKHDDLIMALAIAYYAREQQSMELYQDEYDEEPEYAVAFGKTGY